MTAVRCPNERPHNNYSLCGRLLCAVKDGKIYVSCPCCKQFFELKILENDNVELTPAPRNIRFEFDTKLKVINE